MIIRIEKDSGRVASILKLAEDRIHFVKVITAFPTIIAENYYEIIKELTTAVLLQDGWKAVGEYAHKEMFEKLIDYDYSQKDIQLIDELRQRRNKSMYEGKEIPYAYISQRKELLDNIISSLKSKITASPHTRSHSML